MNVFLDTIGCRLNQSEIEAIASQFRSAGNKIVENVAEADLVVINTCTVTVEAASDSRQRIRQFHHAGAVKIIVTGCWSTLNLDEAVSLPGVVRVIQNSEKDNLVPTILDLPPETFDQEPLARQPLPGLHRRTRAFLKAQDGCDNHCTFCITRLARGASRSRGSERVIADIQAAIKGGAKEIVLTGVQLGAWGRDLPGEGSLYDLVTATLNQTDVQRLRLSSLEPWEMSESFLALWQDSRMCRHLHLPLQSGSIRTLTRMARKTTPREFANLVESIRSRVPDMALTTDVITGFPGETDEDFEESLEFIRKMQFAGGHVFTYSPRPGTPAARYPDPVPFKLKKERNSRTRLVIKNSSRSYRERFIGQTVAVLWEAVEGIGPQGWTISGYTDNYVRVEVIAKEAFWNQISQVNLSEVLEEGMRGEITWQALQEGC